jgi:hypothetical protein
MSNSKDQLIRNAHERIKQLKAYLQTEPVDHRDRHIVVVYNNLRDDVKKFVNAPDFERRVPSIWHLTPEYFLIFLVAASTAAGLIYWLWGGLRLATISTFALFILGPILLDILFSKPPHDSRWRAGTCEEIKHATKLLEACLQEYETLQRHPIASLPLRHNPKSVRPSSPQKQTVPEGSSAKTTVNERATSLANGRLVELCQNITEHFNLGELRMLCFEMGIDHENLAGETKADRARELVTYCERHGRTPELVTRCRILRPNTSWEDAYK